MAQLSDSDLSATMDQCASVLLAFPEPKPLNNDQYHRAARAHVHKLDRLLMESGPSFANLAGNLIEHIDPAVNSMSFLVLLQAVLTHERAPQTINTFLPYILKFLATYDARQIRYFGTGFSLLLKHVTEGGLFPASVAVEILTTALLRLEPSCSVLTSHHIALVELAYITNNIEPALPIIEKVAVFFPVSKAPTDTRLCDMQLPPTLYITVDSGFTAKLTSRLVMQYDLLVANCFVQLRSWERAFDALERLISYPTKDQACSKIMSEGYNKWVLVGLILNGKTPSLPSHIWSGPQKAFATLGKPYASIANAFDTKTAAELKAEFESLGPQFWSDEGNLGLMNYVLAHYQRWKILDLRRVYTKISLEQIRMLTQSAETGAALGTEAKVLELLQDMIAGGMLSGKVVPAADGKPAHLVFLPPAERLSEAAFAAEMLRTSQRIQALAPLINITNDRLGTSRDYVRFLAGQQNGKGKGVLAEALMAFDSQIEDEDLMTGLVSGH